MLLSSFYFRSDVLFILCIGGLVLSYGGKYILTSMNAFATMKVALCKSKFSDLLCASLDITDRNNLMNREGGYL